MLVGEAGIDPVYFHTRLTFHEANLIIKGYNRRHRHTYEAARLLHGCIGGLFAKNYHMPEFPWDKEGRKVDIPTEDEIAKMRAEGEAWAEQLNKRPHSPL